MEMGKLIEMLTAAGIPFEVQDHWSGTPQVCYPVGPASSEGCICDVVCFPGSPYGGSYGGNEGFLEIMGLVDEDETDDEVEGWLTAEQVFDRIKSDYECQKIEATTTTFTYDRNTDVYTDECNTNIDYIIRNLPGVTVTAEKGRLVQVSADKQAARIIQFFDDCDMIVRYTDLTIEEVEKEFDY